MPPAPVASRTRAPCEVWWADTGWLRAWHEELLDGIERARLCALRRAADRARFVAGCAVLRLVLGARLGIAPAGVPLDRTCPACGEPHGRPRLASVPLADTPPRGGPRRAVSPTGTPYDLADTPPRGGPRRAVSPAGAPDDPACPLADAPPGGSVHVSVSHAGSRVAVAVGPVPVGVDVERVDPALDLGPLAAAALTDSERDALERLPADERGAGFLALWTRKEAVLKATGDGLTVDPRTLAVSGPAAAPRLLSFTGRRELAGTATLVDLDPGPDHVATLAILGTGSVRQLDAGPLLSHRP